MRFLLQELRNFTRAAMVEPVPRDHREGPGQRRRRQVIVSGTLILGAAALAYALRLPPGDPRFYAATLALAAIWTLGALLAGPLHLGRAHTRAGGVARPIVQSLVIGLILLAVFLAGGLVIAHLPWLREPVETLLDHARKGSLWLVLLITAVNGIAEELYFRGALYAALPRRHAVALSALVYAVITIGPGIALLVLAAAALGLITGMQRRVTGGVLAPMITHLTWSIGMLVALPLALATGG